MKTLKDLTIIECPKCHADSLEWHSTVVVTGGVAQGNLTSNDATPLFFLGCGSCSETITTIRGDDLAFMLTEAGMARSQPNPTE